MILHHQFEKKGTDLAHKNTIQIENQHDMLAYIVEMYDPTRNTFPFEANISTKNSAQNLVNVVANDGTVNIPLFIEISKSEINNFDKVAKKMAESRARGISNQYLDRQQFHQVKATINNPESSRSVVVYEFQIEVTIGDRNIFVPFIIYDLPGKEDIIKTYVDPVPADIATPTTVKSAIFSDFEDDTQANIDSPFNDVIKDHKISALMNPYLVPAYCDSAKLSAIVQYLESLDDIVSHGWRREFFGQLLDNWAIFYGMQVDSRGNVVRKDFDAAHVGGDPSISTPQIVTAPIMSFADFFSEDKINFTGAFPNLGPALPTDSDFNTKLSENLGILESFSELSAITSGKTAMLRYLLTLLIWQLMQYRALDVIARIIEISTGNQWSTESIHAPFESFYINETINGLINFLTIRVLNKSSPYESHVVGSLTAPTSSMREISSTLATQNYYRYIKNLDSIDSARDVNVKDALRVVSNPDLTRNIENNYRKNEIESFVAKYRTLVGMNYDSTVALQNQNVQKLLSTFRSAIYYDSFLYDNNKIFRNNEYGNVECSNAEAQHDFVDVNTNPTKVIRETNRPLIQDFLEPYQEKIKCWHLFYVVTNNDPERKGVSQLDMLENSMKFINILNSLFSSPCTI